MRSEFKGFHTRFFIFGIIYACAVVCCGQNSQRASIPDGVKYKFMDDKENAEVRDFLVGKFLRGNSGVAELFTNECMCAPGYWKLVAGIGIKAPKINSFSVPNEHTGKLYKLDGAQIHEPGDLSRISQYLVTNLNTQPTIRRLTSTEIGRFWVVVPFDIEEPLFVVESDHRRQFVLCLQKVDSEHKWRVWWIDALAEYDWGQAPTQGGTNQAPRQSGSN